MFAQNKMMRSSIARSVFRETVGSGGSDGFDGGGETTSYHVSGVNDAAEIQAERDADRVTGSTFHDAPVGGDGIFRADDGVGDAGGDVSLPTADLEGPGESLPPDLQGSMEQSYGTSFAGVRVHTDASADRLSRRLSARAFTRGEDMYFRDGEYKPDTREGQHLIAHELSHVASGGEGLHREFMQSTDKDSNDMETLGTFALSYCKAAGAAVEVLPKGKADVDDAVKQGIVSKETLKSVYENKAEMQSEVEEWIDKLSDTGNNTYQFPAANSEGEKKVSNALTALRDLQPRLATLDSVSEDVKTYIGVSNNASATTTTGQDVTTIPEAVMDMAKDPAGLVFMRLANKVAGSVGGKDENAKMNNAQAAERAGHDRGGKKHYEEIEKSSNQKKEEAFSKIAEVADSSELGSLDDYELDDQKKEVKEDTSDMTDEEIAENDAAKKHNAKYEKLEKAGEGLEASKNIIKAGANTGATIASGKVLKEERDEKDEKVAELQKLMGTDADLSSLKADRGIKSEMVSKVANNVGDYGEAYNSVAKAGGWQSDNAEFGVNAGVNLAKGIGSGADFAAAHRDKNEATEKKELAKKRMKPLGVQLEKETKNKHKTLIPAANEKRDEKVSQVATTLQDPDPLKKDLDLGGKIDVALEPTETHDKKPDLTGKQRRLLMTAQTLNMNFSNNESKESNNKLKQLAAGLDIASLIADVLSSLFNTFGLVKDSKIVAGALGLVKQALGTAKSGVEAAVDEKSEEQERNDKMGTTRQVLQVMAGLPAADSSKLAAIKSAGGETISSSVVSKDEMENLTEYANVFDMIQSSGVEMVDILYAINKGGFGSGSAENSMTATYKNLSFGDA